MLEVKIEKILPVTEVRDSLNKIVDEVAAGDEMYVLTVNGKPSAVLVGVHHLEKLTGSTELLNAQGGTQNATAQSESTVGSQQSANSNTVNSQPQTASTAVDDLFADAATPPSPAIPSTTPTSSQPAADPTIVPPISLEPAAQTQPMVGNTTPTTPNTTTPTPNNDETMKQGGNDTFALPGASDLGTQPTPSVQPTASPTDQQV